MIFVTIISPVSQSLTRLTWEFDCVIRIENYALARRRRPFSSDHREELFRASEVSLLNDRNQRLVGSLGLAFWDLLKLVSTDDSILVGDLMTGFMDR